MNDERAASAPPLVVGLFGASPELVEEGTTLAATLNQRALGCQLRNFLPTMPRSEAATELVRTGARLALLGVDREAGERVLGLIRLLVRRCQVVLFGSGQSLGQMRALVETTPGQPGLLGALVGEPFAAAAELARRLVSAVGSDPASDLPVSSLAGFYRAGNPFLPRSPLRDLDSLPVGDYRFQTFQHALGIPLRISRGFPFACLFSERRQREMPLRGRSVARVLDDLSLHVHDHGACHVFFVDAAVNAVAETLVPLSRGIVERGLSLAWYGRIWPDPGLGPEELRLLRQSGCRALDLLLWTGSKDLSLALCTGSDPSDALQLCEDAAAQGLEIRPVIQVGFPGEDDADRQATLTWMSLAGPHISRLAELSCCRLPDGVPIRSRAGLVFPKLEPEIEWHDGGENNLSRRQVWRREAATLCRLLDIPVPGTEGALFASRVLPDIERRLFNSVSQGLASSGIWRKRGMHLAGILHGREAYAGPAALHLDLGPHADGQAMAGLIREAARMGTRQLVLGRAEAPEPEDVLHHPDLDALLELARSLHLHLALNTRLSDDQARCWAVASGVGTLRVTWRRPQDLRDMEPRLRALLERRRSGQLRMPTVELRAWIGGELPDVLPVVEAGARLGVDVLDLRAERRDGARLSEAQRRTAADALRTVLAGAIEAPELLSDSLGTARRERSVRDALILCPEAWATGFRLEPDAGSGAWICCCPAQVKAAVQRGAPGRKFQRLAQFSRTTCLGCPLLAGCPVHRLDFTVEVPLMVLGQPLALLRDLEDADLGLGRVGRELERRPCLAGWLTARVTDDGTLYVCPTCGTEPVGHVLGPGSLSSVWYSRGLNEMRRMSVGASLVLPYIDRRLCALGCGREGEDDAALEQIRGLTASQRQALEAMGSDDRR